MNKQYEELLAYFRKQKKVAIAFSGGVDSTFLLMAAKEAIGDQVIAITMKTPYIPNWEYAEAIQFATDHHIRHEVIQINEIPKTIFNNPEDRCYLCKLAIFRQIIEIAKGSGIDCVCDGSNHDDTKDYRPGLRALQELGIESPLMDLKWTKGDIRRESAILNLPTWNKPPYACLMTRIPHNTLVTMEDLRKIEQAEVYMISRGFKAMRVRKHKDLARIEVNHEERDRLFDTELWDDIHAKFKEIGFTFVTIDLFGYKMGVFNESKRT